MALFNKKLVELIRAWNPFNLRHGPYADIQLLELLQRHLGTHFRHILEPVSFPQKI
jgi:hypothetical protein